MSSDEAKRLEAMIEHLAGSVVTTLDLHRLTIRVHELERKVKQQAERIEKLEASA